MFRLNTAQKSIIFFLLSLWALINLFPITVMFISGFKTTGEIFLKPFSLPEHFSIATYIEAWDVANFGAYFKNSVIVTLAAISITLIISSMGAYVLARFNFPWRRALFLFILAGLVLPVRLAIIPIFLVIRSLHLTDTLLALILIYSAAGISFSTFLLTNFFKTIPSDLDDAARIDGAGYFRVYFQIYLPLLRPALATVSVFNFIRVWNDFFFPLILIDSSRKRTIPLGIQNFFGEYNVRWDMLFAGLNIAVIPIIIFFILLSKQFISGLTEGAIK